MKGKSQHELEKLRQGEERTRDEPRSASLFAIFPCERTETRLRMVLYSPIGTQREMGSESIKLEEMKDEGRTVDVRVRVLF